MTKFGIFGKMNEMCIKTHEQMGGYYNGNAWAAIVNGYKAGREDREYLKKKVLFDEEDCAYGFKIWASMKDVKKGMVIVIGDYNKKQPELSERTYYKVLDRTPRTITLSEPQVSYLNAKYATC